MRLIKLIVLFVLLQSCSGVRYDKQSYFSDVYINGVFMGQKKSVVLDETKILKTTRKDKALYVGYKCPEDIISIFEYMVSHKSINIYNLKYCIIVFDGVPISFEDLEAIRVDTDSNVSVKNYPVNSASVMCNCHSSMEVLAFTHIK